MVPKELDVSGVYVSPMLVVFLMALAAAWATAWLLNHVRMTRYIVNPPLVFVAVVALYFSAFGTFIFRV